MESTHYSYRKLRRKAEKDGLKPALFNSFETINRRKIFPAIFKFLKKYGLLRVLEFDDLRTDADETVFINSNSLDSSRFVLNMGSGYIVPKTGLCLRPDGSLISAGLGSPDLGDQYTIESLAQVDFTNFLLTPRLILNMDLDNASNFVSGPICPLSPRYINYYHWMVGTVPKLRYIDEYEQSTGQDVKLLVPNTLPKYVRESLCLLGYPQHKYLKANNLVYKTDQLILPSHPYPGTERDYQWIRDRMFQEVNPETHERTANVYITRRNAIGRRVVNEDQVINALRPYGFEAFCLEDRSVSENIKLFANADAVVSPHGAGLTDILFSQRASVIELFGSRINTAYEQLAELNGLEYHRLICEPEATDIRVNIDELEQLVASVL